MHRNVCIEAAVPETSNSRVQSPHAGSITSAESVEGTEIQLQNLQAGAPCVVNLHLAKPKAEQALQ